MERYYKKFYNKSLESENKEQINIKINPLVVSLATNEYTKKQTFKTSKTKSLDIEDNDLEMNANVYRAKSTPLYKIAIKKEEQKQEQTETATE